MKINAGLILAIFNSSWSALIAFCMIPVYVKTLGIESFAIISHFATLNLFLQILDFGIYPTIIRETSQKLNGKIQIDFLNKIRSFFTINLVISAFIFLVTILTSNYLAENWFNNSSLSKKQISNCLILIGLQISFRWPILIFQGALYGSPFANYGYFINIVMITFNAIGSLILIFLFEINLFQFLIWQVISGLIYTIIIYCVCEKKLQINFTLNFRWEDWKKCLYLAFELWFVTASGILYSQVDKLILTKFLSLDNYGIYMLAVSAAAILQIIINPFYTIYFPRFSRLFYENQIDKIVTLYNLLLSIISSFLLPIGLFLIITSELLIYLWTRDINLAKLISPIFNLLIIASIYNGINYIPFILKIACSRNWLPFMLNIIFTIITIPLIITLVKFYGTYSGAIVLMINQLVIFFLNPILVKKYVQEKIYIKNYFLNLSMPTLTFIIGFLVFIIFFKNKYFNIELFLVGFFISVLCFTINIIGKKDLRSFINELKFRIYDKL